MQSLLPLVVRSSLRSRRRSALTILSIAVSFCLFGVLGAMYGLFFHSEANPDQALRLIVRNRISFANPIPISYADRIRPVAGVKEVMVQQWFGGTYRGSFDAGRDFARFAVEPEKLFTLHPEYAISADEFQGFLRRQDSCILGRQLAKRLNLKLGDRITLRGDLFPVWLNLVVSGFYDSATDNDALYFHNVYLKHLLRKDPNFTIMLTVLVDSPAAVESTARRIDELFRNATTQTRTETEKGYRVRFLKYLGNVKLFLFAIAGALAGMVLLVSANAIAMSVRERTQEVGVLKALGFAPDTILVLITGESALLSVLGCLSGIAAASVSITFIRELPLAMVNLNTLTMSAPLAGGLVLLAAVCGGAAALPAAWQVSRRSIADALRQAD